MKGVIAAGSEFATQVGANILASGGNAISAAVAACMATSASEPALASLGGGGVFLIHNRSKKLSKAINFFANMPGLSLPNGKVPSVDFHPVDIDFTDATQRFYVGRGSAAAGNALACFCEMAVMFGNLPLEQLLEETIGALSKGLVLSERQSHMCRVLGPIYETGGEAHHFLNCIKKRGNLTYKNEATANFLKKLNSKDWKRVYRDEFCSEILRSFSPSKGGLITKQDLSRFKSIVYEPLLGEFEDYQVVTAPRPAGGGEFVLGALKQLAPSLKKGGCEKSYLKSLCYTLHALGQLKGIGTQDLLSGKSTRWLKEFLLENVDKPFKVLREEPEQKGSTTHVSVLDEEGTAVSVTFSHGEGCGHLIGDTGIMMNNFVGETDINPNGFDHLISGKRLSTMIAPSIVETNRGEVYVLGSGGSSRIRSALVQTILNLIHFGKTPEEAVNTERVHVENGVIFSEFSCENKEIKAVFEGLSPKDLVYFQEKQLYFGGVQVVKWDPSEGFLGAGDPRRNGHCLVVE